MSRRRGFRSGFTLVEVTLAVGVVVFGIIVLTALLPSGLRLVRENSEETTATQILSEILADLKVAEQPDGRWLAQTPRFGIPLDTVDSGKLLFTMNGQRTEDEQQAVYGLSWQVLAALPSELLPKRIQLTAAWPNMPTGSTPPANSMEMVVAIHDPS